MHTYTLGGSFEGRGKSFFDETQLQTHSHVHIEGFQGFCLLLLLGCTHTLDTADTAVMLERVR